MASSEIGPDRRRVLQAGGLTALAGLGTSAVARPGRAPAGGPPVGGRIDVHHHALTPVMRKWAVDNGLLPPQGGPRWADWTLAGTLATMDAHHIAAGVASTPVPAEAFRNPRVAESGVKLINEELAELVKDRPRRFGFFAYLSLLHVDLALDQLAYALDELGADGVILMTTAGGRYLGDPAFDPVFAELDRRGAVVFTHPSESGGGGGLPGISPAVIDFLFDTTRAALNLIASGTLLRHPRVSVVLSHAGGFLPYAAGRIKLVSERGEGIDPVALRDGLRRFHYDTALPAAPTATPTLLTVARPTQLLYGTDWPARPAGQIATITRDLDRDPELHGSAHRKVNRDNALRLLPKLGRRLRRA